MTKPKKQTKCRRGQSASKARLGDFATHGFAVHRKDGAVKREIHIYYLSSGNIQVLILTWWKEKDEPIITDMTLSPVAFSLLQRAMFGTHQMHIWPLAPKDEGQ